MRNFGFIRSSLTGDILRLAPNFDNNRAYLANPSGIYSDGMLKLFIEKADSTDLQNLNALTHALEDSPYMRQAYEACLAYLK